MTPLRLCLVAPYDLSLPGGVNTHIRAQARALRARSHDVVVCGPASAAVAGGEIPLGGTMTVAFGGTETGFGIGPRGSRAVRELFTAGRFDIVHVHEPLMPFVPWSVVRQANAPLVGTFHVHRERGHAFYRPGRPFLQTLIARLAVRIAVSDAARRTVSRYFPGDYTVIPNGIEIEPFETPHERPAAFAGERPHVLVVGRLEPRKGVDHLFSAMADVRRRLPQVRLVVVGDGPTRAALERLAGDLDLDAHFAGRVDDEALPAYFQAADVVAAPATRGESFGLVLVEAMAAGRPVVASRIEGYAELIAATRVGTLVPPADPAALAAAILELLGQPERRRREGEAGRAAARAFAWPALAERLEDLYRSIK